MLHRVETLKMTCPRHVRDMSVGRPDAAPRGDAKDEVHQLACANHGRARDDRQAPRARAARPRPLGARSHRTERSPIFAPPPVVGEACLLFGATTVARRERRGAAAPWEAVAEPAPLLRLGARDSRRWRPHASSSAMRRARSRRRWPWCRPARRPWPRRFHAVSTPFPRRFDGPASEGRRAAPRRRRTPTRSWPRKSRSRTASRRGPRHAS